MEMANIYPEPNSFKAGEGFFSVDGGKGVYIHEQPAGIFPGALEKLEAFLGPGTGAASREMASIILRKLDAGDIAYAESIFRRKYAPEKLQDAYFLEVSLQNIHISASTHAGFIYALHTLEQMAVKEGAGPVARIRCGVVFDYPYKAIRAVRLAAACSGPAILERLVRSMARLKYNTLILKDWQDISGDKSAVDSLEKLCRSCLITLVRPDESVVGLIENIHGPSLLDWEHKSCKEGVEGASVAYGLRPEGKGFIEESFLYNLVYCSYLLWNGNYNNFSWERVADISMQGAFLLAADLSGRRLPTLYGCSFTDIYPIPLESSSAGACKAGGSITVEGGCSLRIAQPLEKADSLVFTHTLVEGGISCGSHGGKPETIGDSNERDGCYEADDRIAGIYTVIYEDGTSSEVMLERNINIGPENIWWGRRYNPYTHEFDTDRRLESLCCMTVPVRKIRDNGACAMDFEFEWINPKPSTPVKEIHLSVRKVAGISSVKVTTIKIVAGWKA